MFGESCLSGVDAMCTVVELFIRAPGGCEATVKSNVDPNAADSTGQL